MNAILYFHMTRNRLTPVGGVVSEPYRRWQCFFCGFIYDEAVGMPEEGIKAGTRWEDIPADWACPGCGAAKSGFTMIEFAA